jgi:hypothetical protein
MVEVFRNPRRADWGSFRTDLSGSPGSITKKITDFVGLETAVSRFQDAIISVYNDNCPLTARGNSRNVPWLNHDLAEWRKKVRSLFNAAQKSGNWTDYKRSLTDYNNVLRKSKRKSWRRNC